MHLSDILGNGANDATTNGVWFGNATGNGAAASVAYLQGGTSNTIVWPQGSIPATFTVCSLTRYAGVNKNRILTSTTGNWLQGHQSGARGRTYYQSSWQTSLSSYGLSSADWTVLCGKNSGTTPNNILVDGYPWGTAVTGPETVDTMVINAFTSEQSDFQFSQLMIWNQALSDADMLTASGYLMSYLYSGSYTTFSYNWPYTAVPRPNYGWYSAEFYNAPVGNNVIWDRSGHNHNAATSGVTAGSGIGNGATAAGVTYVTGTTTSTIQWPPSSIPNAFTICGLTRYVAGGTNQLILASQSTAGSSYSYNCGSWSYHEAHYVYHFGHYNPTANNANAYRGVLWESAWCTSQASTGTLTDWLNFCFTHNGDAFIDGVQKTTGGRGCTNGYAEQLTINLYGGGGQSSFAFSQLMIWDYALSSAQLTAASALLASYLTTGVYQYYPSAEPTYKPSAVPSIAPPQATLNPNATPMPTTPTGQVRSHHHGPIHLTNYLPFLLYCEGFLSRPCSVFPNDNCSLLVHRSRAADPRLGPPPKPARPATTPAKAPARCAPRARGTHPSEPFQPALDNRSPHALLPL